MDGYIREACQVPVVINQLRDDCDGESGKSLDSGYIFSTEPVRFVDEFDVDFEGKQKAGKIPKVFGLNN